MSRFESGSPARTLSAADEYGEALSSTGSGGGTFLAAPGAVSGRILADTAAATSPRCRPRLGSSLSRRVTISSLQDALRLEPANLLRPAACLRDFAGPHPGSRLIRHVHD